MIYQYAFLFWFSFHQKHSNSTMKQIDSIVGWSVKVKMEEEKR